MKRVLVERAKRLCCHHLCQCDVQKMSVVIGRVFPGVLWSVQQIIDLDLSSFPLGQERCYQD